MILRDAAPGDRAMIHALVTAAFGQPDEANLAERLVADGDAEIELVAEAAGGLAGHILFSRLAAPFPALALAPVSVTPARQRAGIGSALVRAGLDRASRDGWRGVFVLGDPGYYRRFGFDAAAAAGFASAYAGPFLMALALGGALPAAAGRIAYPRAFDGLA